MKATIRDMFGHQTGSMELPLIFQTPLRLDLIHKAYINLESHRFQPQGRHPTAGMDVVADSNDPPTGRGISRVARARGGGGGRQGQGAEVASTRGGRQAHPPIVGRVIRKRLNKKENRLALCSAIAATASAEAVRSRGHKIGEDANLPIILDDSIESVSKAAELAKVIESLGLSDDVARLESRRPRTGRSSLRGRSKKVGKSVLFVVSGGTLLARAAGAIPGVDVKEARHLSVLDLAPGAQPARLTVYSESAMGVIGEIKATHLEVMVKRQ